MKKGFFYYFLAISLIFHLAILLVVRLDTAKRREKEPVVIDLLGAPKPGPVTRLPEGARKSINHMVAPHEKGRDIIAKTTPLRPSLPLFPVPRPEGAPAPAPRTAPAAPAPVPGPGLAGAPPSALRTGPASHAHPGQSAPAPSSTESPRIIGPTTADLMRYAKIDRETEKDRDNTITLDTEDLEYTSYLQALKKRIELIWKYPETARESGIQGSLVMRFSIARSGSVDDIEVIKSSGYPELDRAARRALIDANPFNPLPDSWKKNYFTITGTFVYRLYGQYLE